LLKIALEIHHSRDKTLVHPMRRRDFLVESGRAALGLPFLGLMPRAQGAQKSSASKDASAWEALAGDLEKQLPKLMDEAFVPGLSIALIKDAKLFWRRAFGVKDSGSKEPVDDDTVFEAGSVSKTVFAYLVMKLCEKGVIGLDTPLTKYAPQPFLQGDPRLELITARHILSHTGGFQNWRSKDKPLQIHFAPGEKFRYSGEGYYYLQSVVTHLTGHVDPKDCSKYEAGLEVCATDIDSYIKAHLLAPFGMASSGYLWNDTFEKRAARPHDAKGAPLPKKKPRAPNVARYGAAGGLHTTPTDYAKFLIEVIEPKQSDAFRLKKESLEEMVRPHVKTNDADSTSWALGWQIRHTANGNLICHGGYNTGFHSFAAASVERKSGYVFMINGDNAADLLKKLSAKLNQFLMG
jgi:CubicO group peptidase (beta-lactamase class C family)